MICKVCKRYFRLKAENRYIAIKTPSTIVGALHEETKAYECFDCPKCGCQNIVNVREGGANDRDGN